MGPPRIIQLLLTCIIYRLIDGQDDSIFMPTSNQQIHNLKMEEGVPVISGENVRKTVNENNILLIMCYVPWDPRYQTKIKEYQNLAKLAYERTNNVMLAKLDMAADPMAAKMVDVHPPNLQFILYFRGIGYNMDEFTDAKSLAKFIMQLSKRDFTVPQLPHGSVPIKNITRSDFVKITNHKEFSLVIFYQLEDSPASQRLLYSFELAIDKLKKDKRFGYYKFDATDKPDTLAKFGITDLPAIKMFRKGKVYDYNGPLVNPKSIQDYLTAHTGDAYLELGHPDDLEKFLKEHQDRATVVGFFASKALAKFPLFVDAANEFRDEHYFVLMPTPMVSQEGSEPIQVPGWTLAIFLPKRWHTPDDEKKAILQHEDASYKMIVDFIKWKSTPLAGERTLLNEKSKYSLRPLALVYGKIDWSKSGKKDTEYFRDKVSHAAKDHKDMLFAICNASTYRLEMERFGFDMDPKYDNHVGIIGKDGEYYPRWDTTHMTSKMISDFVQQFKAGEIKAYHRSAPVTQNPNFGVEELNGNTFESRILNGDSNALVLFYHPLSSNWRAAEFALRELADDAELKGKNIIYAQLDASKNDVSVGVKLDTYPLVYLFPKDNKKHPIVYPSPLLDTPKLRYFLFEELGKLYQADNAKTKTEL